MPGTYRGGRRGRARGGLGFCCHGRGRVPRARGGGVSLSSGLLLGRNRVPTRQVRAPLTSWMLILPTHASGVDLSVAGGLVDGPGPAGELTALPANWRAPSLDRGRVPSLQLTPWGWMTVGISRQASYRVSSDRALESIGRGQWRLVHPAASGRKPHRIGLPVYKESQATHPPHEPNAQPPISSLSTAVTASLPIIGYPYVQGRWFASRPEDPPYQLGMAVMARRPNYYPAQRPRPCTRLDRGVAVAARQGSHAGPGAQGRGLVWR